MYSGLLIILLPLTLGYFISTKNKQFLDLVHRILNSMVYVILFLMGITLALLENLSANLLAIFIYAITFFICIFSLNLAALLLLDKIDPWQITPHKQTRTTSSIKMVLESLQLCAVLFLGFLIGLTNWSFLHYADKGSQMALMFLLLLVGIQLRNSGMSIRQIFINRRGTIIAFVITISALAGGIIAAWLLGLPIKMGLAMASGFGWYSLTGIVITDAYGSVMGSAAFFNDLARELASIMLIPMIINRFRATALGICGSTSMDFTLPVLQRNGGVAIVPAAIVHGFVLSLITPVLMAFFI